MKNITTKLTLFVAAAALCISINACKKSATDSDLSTVQDEAQAQSESNNIGSYADAGAAQSTGGQPRSVSGLGQVSLNCATITFNADTAAGLKIMTITFSPSCTCFDGKTRSGSIIVSWTGRYRDSETVIHTYTSNYTVNGNSHKYEKWVTNVGRINGIITFNIVDTANITTPTGTISWTSTRQRQWIQGSNTPWQWWNTKYSITGSASGVDRKGIPFTATITSPIILDFSCWAIITQGTYDVQPQGKAERVIDFGSGTCDDNATCTINGVTYTFQFANY